MALTLNQIKSRKTLLENRLTNVAGFIASLNLEARMTAAFTAQVADLANKISETEALPGNDI